MNDADDLINAALRQGPEPLRSSGPTRWDCVDNEGRPRVRTERDPRGELDDIGRTLDCAEPMRI